MTGWLHRYCWHITSQVPQVCSISSVPFSSRAPGFCPFVSPPACRWASILYYFLIRGEETHARGCLSPGCGGSTADSLWARFLHAQIICSCKTMHRAPTGKGCIAPRCAKCSSAAGCTLAAAGEALHLHPPSNAAPDRGFPLQGALKEPIPRS